MRQVSLIVIGTICAIGLSGCEKQLATGKEADKVLADVNALDASNLSEIMLTAADADEAVTYFQRTLKDNPNRIDLLRGLGKSQIRAKSPTAAAVTWRQVVAHPDATDEDRILFADALIRSGDWNQAESVLDKVPPTHATFDRYRLEAMIADSNEEWAKADSFYQTSAGLTTQPASIYNNWGYSKLTRADYKGAEKLFSQAIKYNPKLFTAKNNLVLSRGAQRKYDLPVVPMTQIERAQLLHSLGLSAIKRGDVTIGKGLLQEAIDTHPRHFDAASRALAALESNVSNK